MRCISEIICAKMVDFECLKCRLCRLKRSVGVSCDGNALKSASSMLCFAVLIGIARQEEMYFRNDLHGKRVILSVLFAVCAG